MLKVFNTLGRELQEFRPIKKDIVSFYQCGPTVYSRQHIGNLFSTVKGDLIRRVLTYLGYNVKYVRNITDVGHLSGDNEGDADTGEDRMEKAAKKEALDPALIAKKYSDLYHKDLKKLNALDPDTETIATEYVIEMAEMVQELINKGFAYATEKAIYFEVDKFPKYNELNKQKLEENLTGAGHGDESDSKKKKSYDFAVWFFKVGTHKNALQTWAYEFEGISQPTKEGFPGWHIECSAMSKDTLGETIDFHMGGVEHIPIHHTNEIAQSEAVSGKTFTNYWLHHELLLIDGGKMSKSLGNVYSLDDLEEKGFDPIHYRYFLLQAHYRSKQNFTWEALGAAKNAYEKLVRLLKDLKTKSEKQVNVKENLFKKRFTEALEEDFNLPQALGIMWELIKSNESDEIKYQLIIDFDKVFGLKLEENTNKDESYSPQVKSLIKQREEARTNKDWATADSIRDRLFSEFGVEIQDT